jgi:hypothetical protein
MGRSRRRLARLGANAGSNDQMRWARLRTIFALTSGAACLAGMLAGCGGSHRSAEAHPPEATTHPPTRPPAPTSSLPATTTTAAHVTTTSPTTTTTTAQPVTTASSTTRAPTTTAAPTQSSPSHFPAVVNEAMEALQPPPAGMEAPVKLPAVPAAISAEATKGLDGSYSVTLVATPTPLPVNSPQLAPAAAKPSSELGTFSTTPVASVAAAASYLASTAREDLATCAGQKTPLSLAGTMATTCATAEGPAVNWAIGAWKVQVLDDGGTSVPAEVASAVASYLRSNALPSAAEGLVSVAVPGSPAAGMSTTSVVVWYTARDVYQVSAPGDALAALRLASSMRPWPGA